jgi:hypothetical protein
VATDIRRPLHLETLERRDTPAVTVSYFAFAKSLLIRGDGAADSVQIEQNDATNEIKVTTSVVGSTAAPVVRTYRSNGVDAVTAFLFGGDDTLSYKLTGPEMTRTKFLRFEMGAGNDTATVDFAGQVDPILPPPPVLDELPADEPLPDAEGGDPLVDDPIPTDDILPPAPLPPDPAEIRASVFSFVNGDTGDDTVTARFGNLMANSVVNSRILLGAGNDTSTTTLFGNMAAKSRLVFDVDGGSGNDALTGTAMGRDIAAASFADVYLRGADGADAINWNYSGTLYGYLNARVDGGNGDDTLASQSTLGYLSYGSLFATVNGNNGLDTLTVGATLDNPPTGVTKPKVPPRFYVRADGGLGRDVGTLTGQARGTAIEGVPTPVTPPVVPPVVIDPAPVVTV